MSLWELSRPFSSTVNVRYNKEVYSASRSSTLNMERIQWSFFLYEWKRNLLTSLVQWLKRFFLNCYSEESKTIIVVEDYNKAASLRVFIFSFGIGGIPELYYPNRKKRLKHQEEHNHTCTSFYEWKILVRDFIFESELIYCMRQQLIVLKIYEIWHK